MPVTAMTRTDLFNWLWRLGAMTCFGLAGLLWLVQMSIDRRIRAGEMVETIEFSADGSKVAVASAGSHTIHVWDVPSGTMQTRLELSKASPMYLAFSADSKRLASAAHGLSPNFIAPGRIDVFELDIPNAREHTIFIPDGVVAGIGFVGSQTVAAVLRHAVAEIDVNTSERKAVFPLPRNSMDRLRVADDHRMLLYGSTADSRRVAVFDVTNQIALLEESDPLTVINGVDLSTDGKWLAVAGRGSGSGGRLRVWDVEKNQELSCDSGVSPLVAVRVFSDRSGLLTADHENTLTIWKSTEDGIRRRRQFKVDGYPVALAASNDSEYAAVVSARSVSIWNLESGKLEKTLVDPARLYSQRRIFRYSTGLFVVIGVGLFLWSVRGHMRLPQ
jgi:WD40 repeat protein